MTGTK